MMLYPLYRAVQKLRLNRKTYLFLLIEFVLGTTVVLCGYLSGRAATYRLEAYEIQSRKNSISIQYYGGDGLNAAVTPENYAKLCEIYGSEYSFSYLLFERTIYTFELQEDKVQDVILSSMDENTFEFFFGVQPEPDTVYFGAQIEKDLPNRLFFGRDWFLLDEQGATINGQLLHTATLPDNSDFLLLSAMESENVDTAQLIVLPFSQLNMLTANADAPMAYLSVFLQSGQGIDDVQRIADWLQSRHPSYSYTVSDQRAELKKSIRDITQWMELFVWVAKCSLVITTVGIIGVLLIYVEQRRREFVIALTLGATHGTLIFELFCEVLLFSLLGGVISLLLTIFIAPQLSTVTFTVRFSWTCAILAIGIAFGITLICCVCTILGTRSRYPTKIL